MIRPSFLLLPWVSTSFFRSWYQVKSRNLLHNLLIEEVYFFAGQLRQQLVGQATATDAE